MSRETSIIYLRAGRKVRARGIVLDMDRGMIKVKPNRKEWATVWITAEEAAAGKTKPAPIERKAAAGPRAPRKPKPPEPPRWRKLIDQVRTLEIDHAPQGWPTVRMETLSALADELEAAHGLFSTSEALTDKARLDWLLENHAANFECVENIAGNLERYHIPATREAIDAEISQKNA
jgi:hypothetical protein